MRHFTNQFMQINVAILTVSDTRTVENDFSGQEIQALLRETNHKIVNYEIVKDDVKEITSIVLAWCVDLEINTIIINGGTGFSQRDTTYEAVSFLLEKEMKGFGELFRSLSFQAIGANAMFSRSVAGCRNKTAIYALPGSTNAVKLGMESLILPTVHHFVEELHRS